MALTLKYRMSISALLTLGPQVIFELSPRRTGIAIPSQSVNSMKYVVIELQNYVLRV